jgi:rubredoxin
MELLYPAEIADEEGMMSMLECKNCGYEQSGLIKAENYEGLKEIADKTKCPMCGVIQPTSSPSPHQPS